MKNIVVVSDTHGNKNALKKMENIILESDYAIHLGDGLSDIFALSTEAQNKFILITGNCDGYTGLETQKIIKIEDVNIFMTHGHLFGVKTNREQLIKCAKENNCDVALYGHTHKCCIEKDEQMYIINPGTLSKSSTECSFCYLVIEKNKVVATINKKLFIF